VRWFVGVICSLLSCLMFWVIFVLSINLLSLWAAFSLSLAVGLMFAIRMIPEVEFMARPKKEPESVVSVSSLVAIAKSEGFKEGQQSVILTVVRALGFEVSPPLVSSSPPLPPSPPPEPRKVPGVVCVRCGHGREDHMPLEGKSCYALGCVGCRGFALKKHWYER
jgi:hypothetical protein